MNNIYITLIEIFYIIYMMNIYKSNYSFSFDFFDFKNALLKHPIGYTEIPKNMVCYFGKIISYIISIFLILRLLLYDYNTYFNIYLKFHNKIIIILLLMSIINLNILIYMIPVFILEFSYCY